MTDTNTKTITSQQDTTQSIPQAAEPDDPTSPSRIKKVSVRTGRRLYQSH